MASVACVASFFLLHHKIINFDMGVPFGNTVGCYIHYSSSIYPIFFQLRLYRFYLYKGLNCKFGCSSSFLLLSDIHKQFFISLVKYFDCTSLGMHLSARWIWLISRIWRFSSAKLIVTFLFLVIYPKTILISVQIYSVNSFISNSFMIKADISCFRHHQCAMHVSLFINQFQVTTLSIT